MKFVDNMYNREHKEPGYIFVEFVILCEHLYLCRIFLGAIKPFEILLLLIKLGVVFEFYDALSSSIGKNFIYILCKIVILGAGVLRIEGSVYHNREVIDFGLGGLLLAEKA